MKITALTASLSESSTSNRLAQRILDAAAESASEPVEAEVINLRGFAHELVDSMLTGVPSAELDQAYARLQASDAVVLAAPVYNAAPIGLLTMFLQLFPDAGLRGIPVLLASTGGTARHSLAMDQHIRPVIAYLKGLALPTTVFAATDDWGLPEEQTGMNRRIQAAADELIETAAGSPRRSGPVDEFDPNSITPFDQLLGR